MSKRSRRTAGFAEYDDGADEGGDDDRLEEGDDGAPTADVPVQPAESGDAHPPDAEEGHVVDEVPEEDEDPAADERRKERKKSLADVKAKIRELLIRYPNLEVDVRDTIGARLANLDYATATIVYENMLLQVQRGTDWTDPEKAAFVAFTKAQEFATRIPSDVLYAKIMDDGELRADFRNMTGGALHLMPSWMSFTMRLGMKFIDQYLPGAEKRLAYEMRKKSDQELEAEHGPPPDPVIPLPETAAAAGILAEERRAQVDGVPAGFLHHDATD